MKKKRKRVKKNKNGKWVSPLFSMITSFLEDILLFVVTKMVAFLGVTIQCCNYLGYFISVLKLLKLSF